MKATLQKLPVASGKVNKLLIGKKPLVLKKKANGNAEKVVTVRPVVKNANVNAKGQVGPPNDPLKDLAVLADFKDEYIALKPTHKALVKALWLIIKGLGEEYEFELMEGEPQYLSLSVAGATRYFPYLAESSGQMDKPIKATVYLNGDEPFSYGEAELKRLGIADDVPYAGVDIRELNETTKALVLDPDAKTSASWKTLVELVELAVKKVSSKKEAKPVKKVKVEEEDDDAVPGDDEDLDEYQLVNEDELLPVKVRRSKKK
jgi:hypothetical protein